MRINAALLFHEINRFFQVDFMHSDGNNLAKTPMFYNHFFDMDEHIVLVKSGDLTECLSKVNHAIILCIDRPDDFSGTDIGTNDLIILNDPMSQKMAFNILNHILDLFNEWEHDMNEVLYQSRSFNDMVEITGKILGLPTALSDDHFRYIAFTRDSSIYLDEFVTENNELPPEAIKKLEDDPDYHKLELNHDAFLYEGVERCVHKNIYNNGNYVGRLSVILRSDTDDVEYCKAIFNLAAPYLEALYSQYNSFTNLNMSYHQIHGYMHQIFQQRPADREGFLNLMKSLGNKEEHNWRVVLITPIKDSHSIFNSSYLCDQIEHHYNGIYCIALDSRILILQNESIYRLHSGCPDENTYFRFFKGMNFLCGQSRVFHSLTIFDILFHAYQQASFAMERGNLTPDIGHIHDFSDHALEYLILNGSRNVAYQQICHPALLTLSAHDKEHNTSFCKTLQVYMDCNMNAVAASKVLFIHRSSFINRMERIASLVKLNLDNPQERLYINLSFALYRQHLLAENEP